MVGWKWRCYHKWHPWPRYYDYRHKWRRKCKMVEKSKYGKQRKVGIMLVDHKQIHFWIEYCGLYTVFPVRLRELGELGPTF